ncbi:metallophosphoesterase family protein [Gymnodinialimonas sp.]
MRFVPSTKIGSLLVSSIREAAKKTNADPELTRKEVSAALVAAEAYEHNKMTKGEFKTLNHDMSELLCQWAEALEAGNDQLANQLEGQLNTLAANHPFSYADSIRILGRHMRCSSTAHARAAYYRAWEGKNKVPDFAKITNEVPGTGKVAVIGDWGTGEPDADALLRAVMAHSPDVILHLGDVYEAGLPAEIEEHFIAPLDRVCGTNRPPVFTIPGNHEYFCCGEGFFELIDVLNGGPNSDWNQEASFFCLHSADKEYQFLGADSGLGCIDHASSPPLDDCEIEWHRHHIETFPGKTIFMTHHQLISVDHEINGHAHGDANGYGYFNRHFVDAFSKQIPGSTDTYFDRIDLWLWGHAHWFIPFSPNRSIPDPRRSTWPTLKRGQLLGGSAREKTYRAPHPSYDPHPGVDGQVAGWIVPRSEMDPKAPPGELLVPHATNHAHAYGHEKLYNHTFAILDLATGEAAYYEVPSWTDDTPKPPADKQLKDKLWSHKI